MSRAPAERVRLWTVAEFASAGALLAAIRALREAGVTGLDTYSPYPLHGLGNALGLRRSRVPALALAGALGGVSLGYGFMYYINAVDYPLNVGNRPPNSWPAFIPVTFEMGVLLCSLFIFFGLMFLSRLPQPYHPVFEVDAFRSASTHGFWLSVMAAPAGAPEPGRVEEQLRSLGGTNVTTIREEA
jgi:hypothetical protein